MFLFSPNQDIALEEERPSTAFMPDDIDPLAHTGSTRDTNQQVTTPTAQEEPVMTEEKFESEQRKLKLIDMELSIEAKKQVIKTQQQIEANHAAQEQFFLDAAKAQRTYAKYMEAKLGECNHKQLSLLLTSFLHIGCTRSFL